MAPLPQLDSLKRSPRLRLANALPTVLRFEDGHRNQAELETVSLTGGLLRVPTPLYHGSRVKVMFLTDAGAILGAAEMLKPVSWRLQPFRFTALDENSRRRLTSVINPAAGITPNYVERSPAVHRHIDLGLPARAQAPVSQAVVAAAAADHAPLFHAPVGHEPVFRAPVASAPVFDAPVARAPFTHAPSPHAQDVWIEKYRTAIATADEPRSGLFRAFVAVLMAAAVCVGAVLYYNGFHLALH